MRESFIFVIKDIYDTDRCEAKGHRKREEIRE